MKDEEVKFNYDAGIINVNEGLDSVTQIGKSDDPHRNSRSVKHLKRHPIREIPGEINHRQQN